MSFTAIVLISISALLHAGWNLVSKNEKPQAAFFLAANLIGCLFLSPVLFFYGHLLVQVPVAVWWFLALTGFFQAVYMVCLAGAYRHGDISIAYPLIRSSPILVVMAVVFILGRGEQISGQSIIGIVLVVAGSVVLPMRHRTDFRLANYFNLSCLLGLMAAVSTAGYSVIDDLALARLRALLTADAVEISVLYAFIEGLSTCLWLSLFVLPGRGGRAELVRTICVRIRPTALTGVGIYMTYPLVLMAMAFAANVSYVVAFRQISIPLGVALGVYLLGEKRYAPKFWGAAIIFAGLVLVGTG
jgi:uncharacterized membrane protein